MSSASEIEARHLACEAIAKEAGALARRYFDDVASLQVEKKGVQDLVSIADREVETLIRRKLAEHFPDDALIGEELGGSDGGAVWVIDPIDGTANFLRGFPHYAVSIAFVRDGVLEVGVVYDPSRDQLFSARRGGGARQNGRVLRVRDTKHLEDAVVGLGFSHGSPRADFIDALTNLLEARAEFRRVGSAALGLAHVAAGYFDGFWQRHLKAWDALGAVVIVQEAGGLANDFLAGDGLTRGNTVLAANPTLYAAIARAVGVEA